MSTTARKEYHKRITQANAKNTRKLCANLNNMTGYSIGNRWVYLGIAVVTQAIIDMDRLGGKPFTRSETNSLIYRDELTRFFGSSFLETILDCTDYTSEEVFDRVGLKVKEEDA